MLTKVLKLNRDDLLLYLCVEGGVFLLIQVITGFVMAFFRPEDAVLISGILLPIAAGTLAGVAGVVHVTVVFDQALRFGQTRRRALGLTLGLLIFENLFALGLAAVLAVVEQYLCPFLWTALSGARGWTMGGTLPTPIPEGSPAPAWDGVLLIRSFALEWWWYPVILAIALACGLIIGAAVQRFGGKAGWVFWGIWMAACFVPQLFGMEMLAIGSWRQFMIWIAAGLGVAGFVWSLWSMLHAVVKN